MDWLKDKKNQPIVAAVLAVVIVGAVVAMYFLYFKSDSASTPPEGGTSPDAMAPASDGSQSPGDFGQAAAPPDGSMPAASTTPTTQPAANTASASATAKPMERWRPDPFLPPGYRPPKVGGIKLKPHIRDLPTFKLNVGAVIDEKSIPKPEYPQPVRRMSGLILGDKVYAVIESGGKSQVVQPGDMLEDRLASVFKIEKDRVILRTVDEKPRYLVVRMSQGVRTTDTASTTSSPSSPRYPRPRPGGFPGPPGEGLPAPNEM